MLVVSDGADFETVGLVGMSPEERARVRHLECHVTPDNERFLAVELCVMLLHMMSAGRGATYALVSEAPMPVLGAMMDTSPGPHPVTPELLQRMARAVELNQETLDRLLREIAGAAGTPQSTGRSPRPPPGSPPADA